MRDKEDTDVTMIDIQALSYSHMTHILSRLT